MQNLRLSSPTSSLQANHCFYKALFNSFHADHPAPPQTWDRLAQGRLRQDILQGTASPQHKTIEPCLSNHRHFKRYTTCPASSPHKPRISAICTAVSTVRSDLQHNLFPAVCEQFSPVLKGAEQAPVLRPCLLLQMLQVSRAQEFVHSHAGYSAPRA